MDIALNRRTFIKNTSLGLAGLSLTQIPYVHPELSGDVPLRWLDQPARDQGVTWGVPWPKGKLKDLGPFSVVGDSGTASTQTWPLATWPDGSYKWTAHALPASAAVGKNPALSRGVVSSPPTAISVRETADTIRINTGAMEAVIPRKGNRIIASLSKKNRRICAGGKLVALVQDHPYSEPGIAVKTEHFESELQHVTLEQSGTIRTTLKLEGVHTNGSGRKLFPFVVRLYFYAGSDSLRIMHTFVFDGDENKDFISGLGLHFDVDFNKEALYNRHVRFVGEDEGVFAESVQGLTGLRRDPGKTVREAQVSGKRVPDQSMLPPIVSQRMQYIPSFGDYTLHQSTADAFEIQKRTKSGHSWLQSAHGKRSSGTGYTGTPSGGIAFGLRNFWQSYPAQLDIRNAASEVGEIAVWLWAPRSSPMDLRFYHDGMGQDTYAKQLEGLEINYEDYEPGFGTPMGVARTSEIYLKVYSETPENQQLADFAQQVQEPATLTPTPAYMQAAQAFGGAFTVVSNRTELEKQLDFYFNFYRDQVEQHHWYGFWNFGDVMHTYDNDRQMWRYDIGGFAWDNSELSTDIWLWTYFLGTGRADVFRMAEAMTRHTGEVDVHHVGPFSPLGSRHNVMHWGCSAKQLRISTAANRRYYYYLTADERTGDLMREQIEAVRTLQSIVPIRKVNPDVPKNTENSDYASVGFGTDWGAIAAAWLTEWERTGNPEIRQRLVNSMRTIAEQPHGFFTGLSMLNLKTGEFTIDTTRRVSVSHLSAVFGLPEVCFELVALDIDPAFEKAWLDYCLLYNAPPELQEEKLGERLRRLNLQQGHARLTAYAAYRKQDPALAKRAWEEFYKGEGGFRRTSRELIQHKPPAVLNPIDEGPGISTNAVAQWGLAAMQCLAFVGEPK